MVGRAGDLNPWQHMQSVTGHVQTLQITEPGLSFDAATCTGLDLSRANVLFNAKASVFERCDFSRARLRGGTLGTSPQCLYRECRFDRADLRGVQPGNARFESCTFENARLDKWLCLSAEFVRCRFAGPIQEVIFSARVFPPESAAALGRQRNEFVENDFSNAELINVAFVRGLDLSAQQLPHGPEYVRVPTARIAGAREIVERWEPEARDAALKMLKFYSERGYEEQVELFVRRDRPSFVPEPVRNRIWDLLSMGSTPAWP